MLQSRGEVRALFGGMQTQAKDSRRSQVAAASYLYQLAEQVRDGSVRDFDVRWNATGDVEASVTPR